VRPGDIDFDEFKQLVYDGMLLEGAIQDYEDAFNAVDDSGNGTIGMSGVGCLWVGVSVGDCVCGWVCLWVGVSVGDCVCG
jgi:hypothetical protein